MTGAKSSGQFVAERGGEQGETAQLGRGRAGSAPEIAHKQASRGSGLTMIVNGLRPNSHPPGHNPNVITSQWRVAQRRQGPESKTGGHQCQQRPDTPASTGEARLEQARATGA